MMWKERDNRAFEGCEGEIVRVRDKIHIFMSLILGHDIYRWENFGNVIHLLIEM